MHEVDEVRCIHFQRRITRMIIHLLLVLVYSTRIYFRMKNYVNSHNFVTSYLCNYSITAVRIRASVTNVMIYMLHVMPSIEGGSIKRVYYD